MNETKTDTENSLVVTKGKRGNEEVNKSKRVKYMTMEGNLTGW